MRIKWAEYFAKLSAAALKGLLPQHADVKIFDANSDDRRNYYGTDKLEALLQLADQLNIMPIEEECRNQSPSGDSGLDLIGTVGFDDKAKSIFAIFGQCAAQEKGWKNKTLEASPITLRGLFNFLIEPYNVTCIPLCYRQANDQWPDTNSTSGTLLLDRHRLLYLLEKSDLINDVLKEDWWEQFTDQFFLRPEAA
jgi:hypothetical protein